MQKSPPAQYWQAKHTKSAQDPTQVTPSQANNSQTASGQMQRPYSVPRQAQHRAQFVSFVAALPAVADSVVPPAKCNVLPQDRRTTDRDYYHYKKGNHSQRQLFIARFKLFIGLGSQSDSWPIFAIVSRAIS